MGTQIHSRIRTRPFHGNIVLLVRPYLSFLPSFSIFVLLFPAIFLPSLRVPHATATGFLNENFNDRPTFLCPIYGVSQAMSNTAANTLPPATSATAEKRERCNCEYVARPLRIDTFKNARLGKKGNGIVTITNSSTYFSQSYDLFVPVCFVSISK